jgi:hypothetical protein
MEKSGMKIEIFQRPRAKGRSAAWTLVISTAEDHVLFDSRWVSIRFSSEQGARDFGELILATQEAGTYRPPPGYASDDEGAIGISWSGDLLDDCVARVDHFIAHAEWLTGSKGRKGGNWFCAVWKGDQRLWHTADVDVVPRSGAVARWVCELVIALAQKSNGANVSEQLSR